MLGCLKNKKMFLLTLIVLLVAMLLSLPFMNLAMSQPLTSLPVITIQSDGSVDPVTAPVSVNGDVYSLTSNITNFGLYIKCSNIVLDGKGYTAECLLRSYYFGSGVTVEANNVTVKNVNMRNYDMAAINITGSLNTVFGNNITEASSFGIYVEGSKNNIIRNNISLSDYSIWLTSFASNNSIVGNTLDNVSCLGNYNCFYLNSFVNYRLIKVSMPRDLTRGNVFDNGTIGNYWSDYDGKDLDYDGIGDMPYIANGTSKSDTTVTDRYPLMAPYDFSNDTIQLPSPSSSPSLSPTSSSTLLPPSISHSQRPTQSSEPKSVTFPAEPIYVAAAIVATTTIIAAVALVLKRKKVCI